MIGHPNHQVTKYFLSFLYYYEKNDGLSRGYRKKSIVIFAARIARSKILPNNIFNQFLRC